MGPLQALLTSVMDAVSNDPKPDWRQSLIDGFDAVEAERDDLLAAMEDAIAGEDRRAAQYQQERWQRYEDGTKDWSPEERAMAPNPYGTSAGPYGPGGDQ